MNTHPAAGQGGGDALCTTDMLVASESPDWDGIEIRGLLSHTVHGQNWRFNQPVTRHAFAASSMEE